jgi:NADPH-dependent 2,4-dienoyl-CoA reductase/sulfur reductase-like enzyme
MPPHSRLSRKVLAYTSAGTLAVAGGGYYFLNSGPAYPASTRESRRPPPPWLPPGREQNINVLKASGSGGDHARLDLLIVGGGATGAGVAVDAASRGLKVALVERDDFSSGIVAPTFHSHFKSCLTVRCRHRDIVEIDKARPWRRSLLTKGGDGARL